MSGRRVLRPLLISQGGSDLTEQYVKNVATGDQRSLHRKPVEAPEAVRTTPAVPGAGAMRPPPAPPRGWRGALGRAFAYRRPVRARVAEVGLVAAAPASVAFLLTSLIVSSLWHDPAGGQRLAGACCAWQAIDLPRGALLPLLGSAFLVRRPVEVVWTVAATWLVLGPLEVVGGSRRLILLGVLGNVVPTLLVDLCWLATGKADPGLGGLDVGTSGVIVTAAAALAVAASSLPVAAVLAAGLAVDVAAAPGLATAEHLVAVAVGVGVTMALAAPVRGIRLASGRLGRPGTTGPLR